MSLIKSFWPLPGGIRNYFKTLISVLDYIEANNPSYQDLKTWMMQKYSLDSENTTKQYLDVIKKIKLYKVEDKKYYLTQNGINVLKNNNSRLVLDILLDDIFAFEEIIQIISVFQPISKSEIHDNLEEKLNCGWRTDAQVMWRLNWLLSLDVIDITSGKYYLTESGIEEKDRIREQEISRVETNIEKKVEKIESFSHSELEEKLHYIGNFFEFESIKRPRINEMLPEDRQLKSSNKELDGLWIKKIPMGGKIYYPIEVQIGGNLSDTIDRLETVSDFAQKAIIVIDEDQEQILKERLNAKRSKLLDKIVCIKPEDVNKIMAATNALKSFFIELFSQT